MIDDDKPVKNPEFEELVAPEVEMEENLITDIEPDRETVVVQPAEKMPRYESPAKGSF